MVKFNGLIPWMIPMRVPEQQQSTDHRTDHQWSRPDRVASPADSAKRLANPSRGGKHAVEFMLENFRVLSGEGLHKGQGANRPGLVVTPDQQIGSDHTEGTRQNQASPGGQRVP